MPSFEKALTIRLAPSSDIGGSVRYVGRIRSRISFRCLLPEAELNGVDITRSCGVCLGWLIYTCSITIAMEFPC